MWNHYAGRERQGVAVRTTFRALEESIRAINLELPVEYGQVRYVDYRTGEVPRLGWGPLFHKRIEYGGENEVRAILPAPPFKDGDIFLDPDAKEPRGRYIPVRLDFLVREVVVPPNAADWFVDLVKFGVEEALGPVSVEPSVLTLSTTRPVRTGATR